MEYRLVTVLLARIRNIDDWSEKLPRGFVEERLDVVKALFDDVVSAFKGELVEDPTGRYPDSLLAVFPGPSQAFGASAAFLASLEEGRKGLPPASAEVSCAISSGEVALRCGQLIGRPLELVSRLEYRAGPGRVFFTEAAFLALGSDEGLRYHPLLRKVGAETGPEMRAFELLWRELPPSGVTPPTEDQRLGTKQGEEPPRDDRITLDGMSGGRDEGLEDDDGEP